MNLPFSPTFFRKMDIFQQLMEYEGQKRKKHLWEGQKAVLIWAASDQHQHLGSAIDSHHVKHALEYCVQENFISQSEHDRMKGSVFHILESLPTYEFGSPKSNPAYRVDMIINRSGILAGEILIETNNLKNPQKYQRWSRDWYFVYYLAGILLAIQVVKGIVELVKMISQ
jgi:hypothetical protein